ncbi:MAG: hypothetical protein ACRBM6_12080 [Geminicoccales bacterium]
MQDVIEENNGCKNDSCDLLPMLWDRWPAVIAFVVVGVLAVVGLDVVIPDSEEPSLGILSKKIDHLREAHQNYNVLLIGTSRTYRGIDPIQLRRVTERQGCDVRAFNFGVPNLRLTELRHLREHLSPTMLGDFDLILLTPMAPSKIAKANWSSDRIQHFSDWKGYWVSLIDIWDTPLSNAVPKQLYYSALLTGAFAYRQLGFGRLAKGLRGEAPSSVDNPSGDLVDGSAIVDFSRQGYVALDDEPSQEFIDRGQEIKSNPGHFEMLKTKNMAVNEFRGSAAERAWQRFANSMEQLAAFDVPFAMLLPPMLPLRASDQALAEVADAHGVPVLNYNKLDRYPELFERRNWFDYYHVNRDGAELLTNLVGEDICTAIEDAKR